MSGKPLRREDLETLTGVSPIYSLFVETNKTMVYLHGDKQAVIDTHTSKFSFDEWIDEEERVCKAAFL
jgi:hypothetical protein